MIIQRRLYKILYNEIIFQDDISQHIVMDVRHVFFCDWTGKRTEQWIGIDATDGVARMAAV